MSRCVPDEVSFSHVVLEGTPYEVGRAQAEMLQAGASSGEPDASSVDDSRRLSFLTPTPPFLERFSEREAQRELAFFDEHCPGIGDEVQGAADVLGVSVADIAFLGGTPRGNAGCSHFAVLPSATADGHVLVGQNEDCGPGDLDLRLCTTRVQHKAAHIGFSDMVMGRVQGMNEHGLCVTTSWGAPMVWPEGKGLPYFAAVRTLLDRCHSVEHAVRVLAGLPIAWCTNFIVADRGGQAALIEVAGEHRAVKWIGLRAEAAPRDLFLCATNHYALPAMQPHDVARRRESVARHRTITARLQDAVPCVDKETVRGILSDPAPEGVCLHHYSSGLGTLWSMIYDVTEGRVEVCFGAPSSPRNAWRTFGLGDAVGRRTYAAHLPDAPAPEGFWERLPAGMDG
jgi:predicted choloylglycine hydrolase